MPSAEKDAPVERHVLTRYERRPEQKQTVAQMVEWCRENGLDPAEVRVSGGFAFMWKSQETDEEVARRVEHARAAEERHREWLRRRVEEVFGYVIPPGGCGICGKPLSEVGTSRCYEAHGVLPPESGADQ